MMRHTLTSLRPATAAIAAVLVLATSPALAQDAAPASEPAAEPAPAPAPEIALPVLTPEAAPAPAIPTPSQATEVVQQTPAAPAETAAAITPRTAARTQTPSAVRTAPATPAAPAPTQAAPAPAVVPQPAAADAAPVPAPAVPAEPETVSASNDGIYWALGGGSLLLLGGLGAYVMSYRRKPVVVPVKQRKVAHAKVVAEPAAEPATAIAAATATPRAATVAGRKSPLEKMVAAAPSPENPFVTRKARLRRANYILAHGAPEPLHSDAEPVTARAKEKQVRPQQVHSFGKAQNPPRFTFRPATS